MQQPRKRVAACCVRCEPFEAKAVRPSSTIRPDRYYRHLSRVAGGIVADTLANLADMPPEARAEVRASTVLPPAAGTARAQEEDDAHPANDTQPRHVADAEAGVLPGLRLVEPRRPQRGCATVGPYLGVNSGQSGHCGWRRAGCCSAGRGGKPEQRSGLGSAVPLAAPAPRRAAFHRRGRRRQAVDLERPGHTPAASVSWRLAQPLGCHGQACVRKRVGDAWPWQRCRQGSGPAGSRTRRPWRAVSRRRRCPWTRQVGHGPARR